MPRADGPVKCDIVVPVYDQLQYTRGCVESLLANTDVPFRLIIINNGSKGPETAEYLSALQAQEPQRVLVLTLTPNQGYLKAANHGLAHTSAPFVVLMNNDTVAYPGWLSEMIRVAEKDPLIGIVNPQWDPPKSFRGGRDVFFQKCVIPHRGTCVETDWARGFCHLIRREVLDKIGGLDPVFDPGYYDDWDFSMRAMAAGFRCVKAMGAFVFHYKNVTYSVCGEKDQINTLIGQRAPVFYARWGKPLKLLIVDDRACGDIRPKVLDLLRDQNRVILITARSLALDHTNLVVIKMPRGLLWAAALYVLLDDVRHSAVKRFHLILGDAALICWVGRLFRGYAAEIFAGRERVVQGIIKALKQGSFEKGAS